MNHKNECKYYELDDFIRFNIFLQSCVGLFQFYKIVKKLKFSVKNNFNELFQHVKMFSNYEILEAITQKVMSESLTCANLANAMCNLISGKLIEKLFLSEQSISNFLFFFES